jgi:hypothetical protein
MGGRYDWVEAFRKGIMKNWKERTVFFYCWIFFWFWGVWFWIFGEPLQGAPGC